MNNEEAIPWLKGVLTFYRGSGYYDTQRREALKIAIKALERPRGEWIEHNSYFRKCSKCQKIVGFDYIEQEGEVFNYCPNCGADMRGGR